MVIVQDPPVLNNQIMELDDVVAAVPPLGQNMDFHAEQAGAQLNDMEMD